MLWPETTERDGGDVLQVGGVRLTDLAGRYGTPLYVFDEQTLRSRARDALAAFKGSYARTTVVYAGKAYLSPAIVAILHGEGLGLDVVSGGELHAGMLAGVPPAAMTFHGNNKSAGELRQALLAGIGHIAVDNAFELTLLDQVARELNFNVRILLRLNPGIDVHTHDKIKTGVTDSKFGFPLWTDDAALAVAAALDTPGVELVGYHAHLGSQLFDLAAFRLCIETMLQFAATMRDRHGFAPKIVSPGGGFGIAYEADSAETSFAAAAAVCAEALISGCDRHSLPLPELVVEPGRSIVGPAAVAIYEVGAIKAIPGVRTYVSVDGGMADNIRPALYGARYTAALANRANAGDLQRVTIAGKYCESGDVLIDGIDLPQLAPGDLLAVPAVGAYCLALASNYNLAPRPAVVLVKEGEARLIRRRETYHDVLAAEIVPELAT